jgi:deoxyribonuclease V
LTTKTEVTFPYIPGFLSFREAEPMIRTFKGMEQKPDVLLVDGQGIAHPRRIGLASHIGVLLNHPSIGVAKKILVGEFTEPIKKGEASEIVYQGGLVGFAIKSKVNAKPIIVSPGHKVGIQKSLEVVKKCIKNHKLPEPIRMAHLISKRASKDL